MVMEKRYTPTCASYVWPMGYCGGGAADKPVPETVLYGNGGVKYAGFLLDGEMHGEWSWYRTDGSLMRSGGFDRGRRLDLADVRPRRQGRQGDILRETVRPVSGFADRPRVLRA